MKGPFFHLSRYDGRTVYSSTAIAPLYGPQKHQVAQKESEKSAAIERLPPATFQQKIDENFLSTSV